MAKRPSEDETSSRAKKMKKAGQVERRMEGRQVRIERKVLDAEPSGLFKQGIEIDTEETDCETLEGMMELLRISKKERMEKPSSYVSKTVKMRRSAAAKTSCN